MVAEEARDKEDVLGLCDSLVNKRESLHHSTKIRSVLALCLTEHQDMGFKDKSHGDHTARG